MLNEKLLKLYVYEAGLIIEEDFEEIKRIETKSSFTDLVTETDTKVENFLKKKLTELIPDSYFYAEETDHKEVNLQKDNVWIIDPIDGTTNFVHQFPFTCISIALMHKGILVKSIVYNPIMKEMFEAKINHGAYLNNVMLKVSETKSLDKSLLATGFPYRINSDLKSNFGLFEHFHKKVHGIRRAGSAALDLCYVAKGVFDGFWEWQLNPWDVAAGILIIREAGGLISNFSGNQFNFSDDNILATNGFIHQEMVDNIKNYQEKHKST